MTRFCTATAAFAFAIALAAAATAWEGELAGAVQPISAVLENAEKNDFVAVEGRVTDVRIGEWRQKAADLFRTTRVIGIADHRTPVSPQAIQSCEHGIAVTSTLDRQVAHSLARQTWRRITGR